MTATADKRKQARAAARKARDMAEKLEKAAGIRSDAERMRSKRALDRDVPVRSLTPAQLIERLRREADDELWLQSYWSAFSPHEFYALSAQQRQMVADFRACLESGGDRAVAASRGEGKTSLALALMLKQILCGKVRFAILLAANATKAHQLLKRLRNALYRNGELRTYYPEVCDPIADLKRAPQRANTQTVTGERFDNGEPYHMAESSFHWAGDELTFPHVPGSPSSGAIVISQGLDSAARGANVDNERPDLVIIDDPDTTDTQRNPEQAEKLLDNIQTSVAALGSQQRPVARIALMTIKSRCSVAFRLTDRAAFPSWRGRRYRFLETPPTASGEWEQFVKLCHEGWEKSTDDQSEPPIPLIAHAFYLANKDAMDAGAMVSNPNRYDHRQRPEGGTVEASALEHYFGFVARNGKDAAAAELDNDPPADQALVESTITPHRIQSRRSGYERGIVPAGATIVSQGIDVGKRYLHWTVKAWRPEGLGYVIDFGVENVYGTTRGTDVGEDQAIHRAILSRMDVARDQYRSEAGEVVRIGLTLVDSRYRKEAVFRACRDVGLSIKPAAGHGRCEGCVSYSFRDVLHRTADKIPGDGWFRSKQKGGIELIGMDSERWKAWEHDRWLTPENTPGSLQIFGERDMVPQQERDFVTLTNAFAHQICNEKEVEEIVKGVLKRYWKATGQNHFLDASYMADVAANILGLRIDGPPKQATPAKPLPGPGGWFAAQKGKR